MDDHRESNGTRITGQNNGSIETRLGLKAFVLGHTTQENQQQSKIQPFTEINWVYKNKDFGIKMDDVSMGQSGMRNVGEIKLGIDGKLTENFSLSTNVAVQLGSKSYNDTQAMLNMKYNF